MLKENLSVLDKLLMENLDGKKIILFGASSRGKRVLNNLVTKGFKKEYLVFCDNDSKKYGNSVHGVKIINISDFEKNQKNISIIISSSMFNEIKQQLENLGFTNIYYFHNLLFSDQIYEKFGSEFLKILEAVKEKCFMDDDEKYTLYSSMKAVSQLDGSIAEVGTYKGGSAKILCELKDQKKIHLFDTFEGLPQPSNKELVKAGWLSDTSLKSVKNYLLEYNNVFFYKGCFPQTARNLTSEKFCLVHLDTDLYQSTLDSLEFFWPKMVKGGRIISHDYNAIEVDGVKQAFKEFFKVCPEILIEIADTQILVVK